jgi:hypothetical protein
VGDGTILVNVTLTLLGGLMCHFDVRRTKGNQNVAYLKVTTDIGKNTRKFITMYRAYLTVR